MYVYSEQASIQQYHVLFSELFDRQRYLRSYPIHTLSSLATESKHCKQTILLSFGIVSYF